MNCPICKTSLEYHALLESQMPAYRCASCQGVWISANEYLRWVQTQGAVLPEKSASDADLPTWDTPGLKLCPACGHFLMRYRVLPGAQFYVDRCGHCNGVWLDKGELDVLVERNLHDKINQFFTQPWQTHLREEETHHALDKLYREKFGIGDYARLREMRAWLAEHPLRSMLLAYLQAEDPYRA